MFEYTGSGTIKIKVTDTPVKIKVARPVYSFFYSERVLDKKEYPERFWDWTTRIKEEALPPAFQSHLPFFLITDIRRFLNG